MRQASKRIPESAEKTVRDIRRPTRRHHSAEEKIRIVLEAALYVRVSTRRKFDIVMAWAIDRLGRSLSDLLDFRTRINMAQKPASLAPNVVLDQGCLHLPIWPYSFARIPT